jgi:uncharacterized membrane protein
MMLELSYVAACIRNIPETLTKFTCFHVIMFGMMGVVFGPLSRVASLTPAIPGTNGC